MLLIFFFCFIFALPGKQVNVILATKIDHNGNSKNEPIDLNLKISNSKDNHPEKPIVESSLSHKDEQNKVKEKIAISNITQIRPNEKSNSKVENRNKMLTTGKDWKVESSLLTKTVMILLTMSVLFLLFVGYKTYRRRSRHARIKRYGVRLTKGNIEMTPLPLDNDDDDDTVFDIKNLQT